MSAPAARPPRLRRRYGRRVAVLIALCLLAACGGPGRDVLKEPAGHYKLGVPYQISGRWYTPRYDPNYRARGIASWYGEPFHGRDTANGERFDKALMTAAHTTMPLPSLAQVTNLTNGKTVTVRVNDRGPFVEDRVIDLSEAAAKALGFHRQGLAEVEVRFLDLAVAATGSRDTILAAAQPSAPSIAATRPAAPTLITPPEPVRDPAPLLAAPAPAPTLAQGPGSPATVPTRLATPVESCAGAEAQRFVQAAGFARAADARTYLALLTDAAPGLPPLPARVIEARGVHKLVVGPLTHDHEVRQAITALRARGFTSAAPLLAAPICLS